MDDTVQIIIQIVLLLVSAAGAGAALTRLLDYSMGRRIAKSHAFSPALERRLEERASRREIKAPGPGIRDVGIIAYINGDER